jgi:S-adenosylmethionine synthetase
MVTTEENDDSCRLVSFSTSLQQEEGGSALELNRAVFELLNNELASIARGIPGFKPQIPDEVLVNGAGEFSLGGPEGDNGLSGKKLVVDCYGPRVSIGGGALSGKDFYKADRAGTILARRLAKLIVMTGAAQECHATLTFTPGAAEARVISLTDGSKPLDPSRWKSLMDFRLATVGDRFGSTGELVDVARHGHFTRKCRAWERIGPF